MTYLIPAHAPPVMRSRFLQSGTRSHPRFNDLAFPSADEPLDGLRKLLAATGYFKADPRLSLLVQAHFGVTPRVGGTGASPVALNARPVRLPSGLIVPGSLEVGQLEVGRRQTVVRGVSALPAPQSSSVGDTERKTILDCPPTVSEIPARSLRVTIPPRRSTALTRARRWQLIATRAAALAAVLVLSALVGTYHTGEQGDGVGVALNQSPPSSAFLDMTREAPQVPISPRAEQRMSDRRPPAAGNAYQAQVIVPGRATPLLRPPIQVVETRNIIPGVPASVPVLRSEAFPQVSPGAERSPPLVSDSLGRKGMAIETAALPTAATDLTPAAKAVSAKATAAKATAAKAVVVTSTAARPAAVAARRKVARKAARGIVVASQPNTRAARLDLPDILKPR